MSAPGNKQRRADGGRNDWQTPPELFKLLDDEFHFDIDAAASPENALCKRYFSEVNLHLKKDHGRAEALLLAEWARKHS